MRTLMPDDEFPVPGRRAIYKNSDTKVWMDRCAEKGYTAVSWPREYGGAGFTKEQVLVWQEEMRDLNARTPLVGMGINMLGPALLEYGSEAQKLQHLPKIARGETRWCQGYSEPGAGSDLAALRTSAVMDGDDFIINGQKIWTSSADFADWMFCLVRTEPDAPKQEGISFILIDMDDPDLQKYPALAKARGFECTLEDGDALYIPSHWWHWVKYETPSLSLTLRSLPTKPSDLGEVISNLLFIDGEYDLE